jgi:hypothetical protein
MFLNLSKFAKQMKEAYKNYHLDIGNINDGLLISSSHWMVWIQNQHVPNAVKSIVMLLAGTMPEPGSMFTVKKNQPEPQDRIIDDFFYQSLERKGLMFKLVITPVELHENCNIRLIQGPDRQIYGINQEYLNMIDPTAIDPDIGESEPIGPCFGEDIHNGIYWCNDFGMVRILPVASKKIEIPAVLSLLKFREDGTIDRRNTRETLQRALERTESKEDPEDEPEG